MFEKYPKVRAELPEAFKKIYSEHYSNNRNGTTSVSFLAQKLESWMHICVAQLKDRQRSNVLEIGAGTLNHFRYEPHSRFDIVEPFHQLFENSACLNQVDARYSSIYEIPTTLTYDRIISIATFEHITDLPQVVEKAMELLNPNGVLQVAIPNEGGILWRLAYELTTGIEFWFKYKLPYRVLMKYEHVNTADEIEFILNHYFRIVKVKRFGIGNHFSLYKYFECFK